MMMKESFKTSRDAPSNPRKVQVLGDLKHFLHQASRQRKAAGNKSEVREEFLGRRAGAAAGGIPPGQPCWSLGSVTGWGSLSPARDEVFLPKQASSARKIPFFHTVCRGKMEKQTNKGRMEWAKLA